MLVFSCKCLEHGLLVWSQFDLLSALDNLKQLLKSLFRNLALLIFALKLLKHFVLCLLLKLFRHMDVFQVSFDLILAKHLIAIAMFLALKADKSAVKNVAARTFVHVLLRVAYLAK